MTDPFFMLMVMENLGSDYIVWDKAASIDFIAPGKGPVYADFRIEEALLDEIRQRTAGGDKYLPQLHVDVHDGDGTPGSTGAQDSTCGSSRACGKRFKEQQCERI